MTRLLLATFNQGKLEDYRLFCRALPIELISLGDLGIHAEFEEVHPTFEENARAKAEFYAGLSGLPTLADDSGIEIPYYGMEPGVRTRRWAGSELPDERYFEFILEKIRRIPPDRREAQLRAVLALRRGGETHLAEGKILGRLTEDYYRKSRTPGYPWDRVFVIEELGKFYEELSEEENYRYNHRRIAFDKLKPYLL
jgi:XTP/dITP diphosphohydrolase